MKLHNIHYGWIVVFNAAFMMIIYAASMYSRGIFLTSLTEWFSWNRGLVSGAYSLSMIIGGLLAFVSGRMTDRFGPRIVLTFLGVMVGGGLLLMSIVGSIVHVYLIWVFMMGFGASCAFTPITSTIPRWFTERRGLAIGITFAGFSLGGIIWPPIVERLIASIGWQWTYIVVGLITLVAITTLAQSIKQSPQKIGLEPYGERVKIESTPSRLGQGATGLSFSQAFKTTPYRLIGLIRFCSMFIFQLMSVHIFPYAIDIDISELGAAIILSIISISSTVSRLLAGSIADRIGHRLTLFLSTTILTSSLIVLLFSKDLWHFYVFAILFGAAWGGVGVVQVTLVAEYYGFHSLGAILGSLELLLTTGGAIGVYMAGIIFDTMGNYNTSFVICVIQALLVMLFSFMLMRYKHTGATY